MKCHSLYNESHVSSVFLWNLTNLRGEGHTVSTKLDPGAKQFSLQEPFIFCLILMAASYRCDGVVRCNFVLWTIAPLPNATKNLAFSRQVKVEAVSSAYKGLFHERFCRASLESFYL